MQGIVHPLRVCLHRKLYRASIVRNGRFFDVHGMHLAFIPRERVAWIYLRDTRIALPGVVQQLHDRCVNHHRIGGC